MSNEYLFWNGTYNNIDNIQIKFVFKSQLKIVFPFLYKKFATKHN